MHAYNELYMQDAKDNLASFFGYLINDCGLDADTAAGLFVVSGYSDLFGQGNPAFVSGMSGIELARKVLKKS